MVFSYNWLQSFFNRKLPKPEKLAELLTLYSFEAAELKKVKGDFILDIEILPNRAGDCFSHMGIAREIAAILDFKLEIPKFVPVGHLPKGDKFQTKDFVSVEVKSQSYCPRYMAKVITQVKVGLSPKWLRDPLEACGLNSINNIVDVANYVMLETGQPLHAFDLEKLAGRKIVVRFAKDGEKITALDNQKFDLNDKILVIADTQGPLAIAGIKGGKRPEIDNGTKAIVLESANFNPTIIRKGSKELNLKTDASLRFEHGVDPNLAEFAINRAAYLIQKVTGGILAEDSLDIYPLKVISKKIKLDLNYAGSLLGVKIPVKEIKNILERLGFKAAGAQNSLLVEVPTSRLDILIPEDIIEEIGRIYGYEKIIPTFPSAILIPPERNDNVFWENMTKDILKEVGFTEVYNYSFQKEEGFLEVENPTSQEYKYLRPSLITNLLKNIEKNIKNLPAERHGFNQIKIFELGKVFSAQGGPGGSEKRMLSGVASGYDFYQLKGAMDSLFNKLGIAEVWYDDYEATPAVKGEPRPGREDSSKLFWNKKRSAEIKVGDREIGFMGELRNEPFDLTSGKQKLVAFDLDFEKLSALSSEEHEYRPISKYPSTIRDLAVLVPSLTRVEEVLNVIEIAAGFLATDVDLFDIYEGEGITEGQKNLAFHIVYQAQDHTLTSIEVYKTHQKIIQALEENPEWQVRR